MFWRTKANEELRPLIVKMQEDLLRLKANEKATRNATKVLSRKLNTTADLLATLYAKQWPSDQFATAQEQAWAGIHGFRYVLAHLEENWKGTRVPFWKMLLAQAPGVSSIAEFGCNIGANLKAIKSIAPSIELTGLEINKIACDVLALEPASKCTTGR